MAMQPNTLLKKKGMMPWYIYFVGATIFTALAGWLWAESSSLAWLCLVSAPAGFFFAWRAWQQNTQK